MNSNLFHNIANMINLGLAMAIAGLIATGCTSNAAGVLDCSASWLPPTMIGYALIAVNVLKVGVNIVRDGLGGLVKQQPPVK